MSDAIEKEVNKEDNTDINNDSEQNKEVSEKKDATNTDVVNALKEVKEELRQKGESAPTRAQIREALKEKTGFTDAQLDVVEQLQAASLNQSSKKVAELQAKVVWNEFEKEMGGGIDSSIEKLMKEELKQYDVESQGDKVLLQKVYFMSLGIQADKERKARKSDPNSNDKVNNSDKIEGRTIVETNKGSVQGLESKGKSTNNANGAESLSEEEKSMAHKMGVAPSEYAKAKTTRFISNLKGSNT